MALLIQEEHGDERRKKKKKEKKEKKENEEGKEGKRRKRRRNRILEHGEIPKIRNMQLTSTAR